MTKEEFKTCLNDKFYEMPVVQQEFILNELYEKLPVFSAVTDIKTRKTDLWFRFENNLVKDMELKDWVEWRRAYHCLEKQLENDKKIEEINKDFA